ncbi:amino acid permease [Colwelliaceae bacterium BS250]
MEKSARKALGFWTTTALVTGNMVGSGIFLLPAALAMYGGISITGWLLSCLGSLCLAYVFASLSRRVKGSGGPYLYSRARFGDKVGYFVAWGYWFCIIAANAAIAIALVSYLSVFIPELKDNALFSLMVTLFFVWLIVFINLRGVKEAGRVQLISTVIKVIPLFAIASVGLFYLEPAHFSPWNLTEQSDFSAISATAALTMWAFLGLESATIPADEVENPEKNVPRAAILGTLIAAAIYIPGTIAIMGLIPPEILAQSHAPFADAAAILWGNWAYYFIACIAVISCFGTLNGWTLCVAQVPMAVAKDGLFPQLFAQQSTRGVPAKGMILSSALVSLLVMMNYSASLVEQFTFIILLSTLATLLPYLVCSIAHFSLFIKDKKWHEINPLKSTMSLFAICFSCWIIINIGLTTILWGCVVLAAGLPVYILMRRAQRKALLVN